MFRSSRYFECEVFSLAQWIALAMIGEEESENVGNKMLEMLKP